MNELFYNKFQDGINGDIDPRLQPQTTYRSAKNVDIIGTSNLYVAKNLKGTSQVKKIINQIGITDAHILGAYKCVGLYEDVYGAGIKEYNNSLIVFLYDYTDLNNTNHRIYLFDIKRDKLHVLVDTPSLNFNEASIIDAVVYTEQRESSIFFVDDNNEPRKLKCVVSSLVPLASVDKISLRRFYPQNKLTVSGVELGGFAPAGSLQFAFRLYSTSENVYSGWSIPTNAVPISLDGVQEDPSNVLGGIAGVITDKRVNLSIDGTFDSDIYDSVQLAVIKNTDGSQEPQLNAYVLSPSTEIFNSPSSFYYNGDSEESAIDISDIVIEDAAIKSLKTITLKNNRLVGGNVKYSPLDYDRGDIEITDAYTISEAIGHGGFREYTEAQSSTGAILQVTNPIIGGFIYSLFVTSVFTGNTFTISSTGVGSVSYTATASDTVDTVGKALYDLFLASTISSGLTTTNAGAVIQIVGNAIITTSVSPGYITVATDPLAPYAYKNEINSFSKRSCFRDEVYRHAISYVDKYGNWSKGQVLDLSNFTVFANTGSAIPVYSIGTTSKLHDEGGAANGLSYIEVQDWQVASLEPGSYINISGSANTENNGYHKVLGIESYTASSRISSLVYVDTPLITEGTLGQVGALSTSAHFCRDLKYNHSAAGCPDWKFPSRETPGFEILNAASQVMSIGLRIEGIRNHPTWAVGFAILRAKRKKNIIFQSPHIPVVGVLQSLTDGGWSNSNTNGIYSPKNFSLGAARNIGFEPNPVNNNALEVWPYLQNHESNRYYSMMPISYVVPPEYLYNTNEAAFEEYSFKSGDKVRVVDACAFNITNNFAGGEGLANTDRIALNSYAESKDHYYYDNSGKSLLRFYNQFRYYFGSGTVNIKEAGLVPSSGDFYSFSYFPTSSNSGYSSTTDFGNFSIATAGTEPHIKRGIVLGLDRVFGDLTNISLDTINSPSAHATNDIQFGRQVIDGAISIDYTVNGAYEAGWNVTKGPVQKPISSTVIVNVERGLSDFRYGDVYDYNEFLFTGTYRPLSASEIANNTPITVDVFGGDCFITKSHVKISDTQCSPYFRTDILGSGSDPKRINMGLGDNIQILSFYIESEVNCEFNAQDNLPPTNESTSINDWRTEFIYPYNNGYSTQNLLKVFAPENNIIENKTDFPARIQYSDQKVYQSNIAGFDRFRAGSVYDQDETFGAITKLVRSGDDKIYSIQEYGVSYIPFEANIIEDVNGNNLAIRSGDIIGHPQYVNVTNGSQHIGTVQVVGNNVIWIDALNKAVLALNGKVSDQGMIDFFSNKLSTIIPEHLLMSYYDPNRDEYIVSKRPHTHTSYSDGVESSSQSIDGFVAVYNNRIKKWTTEMSTHSDIDYLYMSYANNTMYLLGRDIDGDIAMHSMYTGDYGKILGKVFDSELTYIVNPIVEIPKTFNNVSLNATNRADSLDMTVFKENSMTQDVLGMNFDVIPREGLYKIQILRDSSEARLRGLFAMSTLKIDNSNNKEVRIFSVATKFRPSFNIK